MNSSYKNSLGFSNDIMKINQNYNEVYKKPLPIDSINKYWGEDPIFLKHDETLQKQSYDQANKNFWSFIDHNLSSDNSYTGFDSNGMNSNSQSFQGNSLKSAFSQSGFTGSASNTNKITGLTYQEAKTRAGLK